MAWGGPSGPNPPGATALGAAPTIVVPRRPHGTGTCLVNVGRHSPPTHPKDRARLLADVANLVRGPRGCVTPAAGKVARWRLSPSPFSRYHPPDACCNRPCVSAESARGRHLLTTPAPKPHPYVGPEAHHPIGNRKSWGAKLRAALASFAMAYVGRDQACGSRARPDCARPPWESPTPRIRRRGAP
jgi:hypothetical protein